MPRKQKKRSKNYSGISLFLLFIIGITLFLLYFTHHHQVLGTQTGPVLLPGQQIWKNGVSSLLFGTNNTYEYSVPNIMTDPSIAQQLKDAGFTLLRTDFFNRVKYYEPPNPTTNPWPSDSEIEARIQLSERMGAVCLGDIYDPSDIDFAKHLVGYLGDRCNMYEFGNEPNGTPGGLYNYTIAQYLTFWNNGVPQLRALNPRAKFIGPTLDYRGGTNANSTLTYMHDFLVGVKASGVLPDALSFHFYPCVSKMTQTECLSHATDAIAFITNIRSMSQQILGKTLPIGISEWNVYSAPPYPLFSYDSTGTFQKAFVNAVLNSFIQTKLDFAAQFDAGSGAVQPIPGAGFLDLFDVYNKTSAPKPQFYAMKAIIAAYRPPTPTPIKSGPTPTPGKTASCPVPKILLLTPYCDGQNYNLSRLMVQWSNANPNNINATYNLELSYKNFTITVLPQLLPSTRNYWDYKVSGTQQKDGYAYANYPFDKNGTFDFKQNSTIYARITYIDGACAGNTTSTTASVSLSICE